MNMIVAEGFGDSSTVRGECRAGIEAHSDLAHRSHFGSIPRGANNAGLAPRVEPALN